MVDVYVMEGQGSIDSSRLDELLSQGKRVWAFVPMSLDPLQIGREVCKILKGREFRIYSGRDRDSRMFANLLDSALEDEPSGWILTEILDSAEDNESKLK